MNRFTKLCITACIFPLCASTLASEPEENREVFVVLSKDLSKGQRLALGREFQKLIGISARPGDVVHLLQAPSHQPLLSLVVPEGHHNARLRHREIRQILPTIKTVFTGGVASEVDHPQLRFPALGTAIASQRRTSFACHVVVVGSPIYDEASQSGWSMKSGRVPSDGAIDAPFSPFTSESRFPDGTTISWITPKSTWELIISTKRR